jgi:hypothetical protein
MQILCLSFVLAVTDFSTMINVYGYAILPLVVNRSKEERISVRTTYLSPRTPRTPHRYAIHVHASRAARRARVPQSSEVRNHSYCYSRSHAEKE